MNFFIIYQSRILMYFPGFRKRIQRKWHLSHETMAISHLALFLAVAINLNFLILFVITAFVCRYSFIFNILFPFSQFPEAFMRCYCLLPLLVVRLFFPNCLLQNASMKRSRLALYGVGHLLRDADRMIDCVCWQFALRAVPVP